MTSTMILAEESSPRGATAINAAKTHCKHGHHLAGDNLSVRQIEGRGPQRVCLACQRQRETARRRKLGKPERVAGRCRSGHLLTSENAKARRRPDGSAFVTCMTCATAQRRAYRHSGRLTEFAVRRILGGLREGRTIWRLDRGGIANVTTINRFCENHPDIGKVIRRLAERNRIAARRTVVTHPTKRVRRAFDDVFSEVRAACAHLHHDIRDDVIQFMVTALLEDTIRRDEIAASVPKYRAMANRLVPSRFGISLDRAYGADQTPLIETIERGLWS